MNKNRKQEMLRFFCVDDRDGQTQKHKLAAFWRAQSDFYSRAPNYHAGHWRSRKKERAVIRSLGAGRLRVMTQSILEYALICLPVTLFVLTVWRELSPMTVIGVWLAFMAGALCTIVRFSMISLVKQIRELEE